MLVSQSLEFGTRSVLDRMRHEDDRRVVAQRLALGVSSLIELGRDDIDRRHAATIKVCDVVQTARCT